MSEQLMFIVREVNKLLNVDYDLSTFKSLNPAGLLQVVSDVFLSLTQTELLLVNDHNKEETCLRILLTLNKVKYVPSEDYSYIEFREGVINGQPKDIYPILEWVLANQHKVAKSIYLSEYIDKVIVPSRAFSSPDIYCAYSDYENMVKDFCRLFSSTNFVRELSSVIKLQEDIKRIQQHIFKESANICAQIDNDGIEHDSLSGGKEQLKQEYDNEGSGWLIGAEKADIVTKFIMPNYQSLKEEYLEWKYKNEKTVTKDFNCGADERSDEKSMLTNFSNLEKEEYMDWEYVVKKDNGDTEDLNWQTDERSDKKSMLTRYSNSEVNEYLDWKYVVKNDNCDTEDFDWGTEEEDYLPWEYEVKREKRDTKYFDWGTDEKSDKKSMLTRCSNTEEEVHLDCEYEAKNRGDTEDLNWQTDERSDKKSMLTRYSNSEVNEYLDWEYDVKNDNCDTEDFDWGTEEEDYLPWEYEVKREKRDTKYFDWGTDEKSDKKSMLTRCSNTEEEVHLDCEYEVKNRGDTKDLDCGTDEKSDKKYVSPTYSKNNSKQKEKQIARVFTWINYSVLLQEVSSELRATRALLDTNWQGEPFEVLRIANLYEKAVDSCLSPSHYKKMIYTLKNNMKKLNPCWFLSRAKKPTENIKVTELGDNVSQKEAITDVEESLVYDLAEDKAFYSDPLKTFIEKIRKRTEQKKLRFELHDYVSELSVTSYILDILKGIDPYVEESIKNHLLKDLPADISKLDYENKDKTEEMFKQIKTLKVDVKERIAFLKSTADEVTDNVDKKFDEVTDTITVALEDLVKVLYEKCGKTDQLEATCIIISRVFMTNDYVFNRLLLELVSETEKRIMYYQFLYKRLENLDNFIADYSNKVIAFEKCEVIQREILAFLKTIENLLLRVYNNYGS